MKNDFFKQKNQNIHVLPPHKKSAVPYWTTALLGFIVKLLVNEIALANEGNRPVDGLVHYNVLLYERNHLAEVG